MAESGAIRYILGKELLHAWRDRSVLILIFLMPLALAGITTLAFGGLGGATSVTIGVVNQDGGPSATILSEEVLPSVQGPAEEPLVTVVNFADVSLATAAVLDEEVSAVIVIPAGFSAAVADRAPSSLTLLAGGDGSFAAPVAQAVLDGFSSQIATNTLSITLATTGVGGITPTGELVAQAGQQRSPVDITAALTGARGLSAAGYFAPAMVILALFFCGQIAARGLINERSRRTLSRIALSPTGAWQLVAGKFVAALLVGLASATLVLAVFAIFGARFGSLPVVALMVVASALAMISVSTLLVLLAKDDEQAGNLATVVTFLLAVLGGNFIPLSSTPPLLDTVALFTPNGWAVRGFADLSVASGDALGTVAPTLLVLLAFTVAAGIPSVFLARRVLRSAGV